MKSHEITFAPYQVYHTPEVTRSIPHKKGSGTPMFRCALPFILFDIAVIGIALFLYAVQKRIIPVSIAVFLPYSLIFFFLARIRTGLGGRYGRCVVFSYLSIFVFFLTFAALALVVDLGILHTAGFVGAGCLLFISNFILLPFHRGRVLKEENEMLMNENSSLCRSRHEGM